MKEIRDGNNGDVRTNCYIPLVCETMVRLKHGGEEQIIANCYLSHPRELGQVKLLVLKVSERMFSS